MNSKIKVIIPSYKRGLDIKTHLYFQELPELYETHIVIHDEEDAGYFHNPSINSQIHVSYAPAGVVNQRNWILEQLLTDGEWFIMADDNIYDITTVTDEFYYQQELPVKDSKSNVEWNRIFLSHLDPENYYKKVQEDITIAENIGANVISYATTPNPFFRERKYREIGYVLSKLVVMKKTDFRYDTQVKAMDDYQLTAEHILRYGKVLLNNFIKPMAKHYQEGGIGTYSSRLPKKIQDCIYLRQKYPGFFRYKTKSGKHPYAELQVCFNSEKQVERWRFFMKKVYNNGRS